MKKFTVLALLATTACAAVETPVEARRVKPPAPLFSISVSPSTATEESGNKCFTITKTGSNGRSSVINFQTVEGSAEPGSDYTETISSITFSSTTTVRSTCVAILDDTQPEPPETFSLELTGGSNARLSTTLATVTLTDTDLATKVCWDGSVISASLDCPTEPSEPPPSTQDPIEAPSLAGLPSVPDNFDVTTSFKTISVAASDNGIDPVGAFRFICRAGQLLYDDPMVYPGQAGESHLHQFYGNESADANSTTTSLRETGKSGCNDLGSAATTAGNRSAYWMPGMIDTVKNKVVRPDYVAIYYKRRPKSDIKCQGLGGTAKGEGTCVELPNGLRFIFGYDMLTATPPTGTLYYDCKGNKFGNLVDAGASGACIPGSRIGAVIKAPACWNGTQLDTPNHRDHVAYAGYGTWGYLRCPASHPYVVAGFTLQAWYTIGADENVANWKLSSDDHARMNNPTLKNGASFHADWWGAWSNIVLRMWHDNCIDRHLNCSSGDLGNSKMLIGADQPRYLINGTWTPSWTHPDRLIDIPVDPTP